MSSGQVLPEPYDFAKAGLVAREMADQLALDLVEKRLLADRLTLLVGYDAANLADPARRSRYEGPVRLNHYGKAVPKEAHGAVDLGGPTSSGAVITAAVARLFAERVAPDLLIRRLTLAASVIEEDALSHADSPRQPDLFADTGEAAARKAAETAEREREKRLQRAILGIRKRMGGNAILKGMNLREGATGKARNEQIGGHRK